MVAEPVPRSCMKTSDHLTPGGVYSRADLKAMFGITDATINNGVFHPKGHESVWLFVTETKTPDRVQYRDQLEGDTLIWDGQSKSRTDHLIKDHVKLGLEVVLFYRKKKYEHPGAAFNYEGVFNYASHTGYQPTHFVLRRASASTRQPSYRALLVDPRYEVEAACRFLSEDTWTISKGDVEVGDRLIFWKTKGRERHRGIVALGEVIERAKDNALPPPESAAFWTDGISTEPKRRFRFRYVVPPRVPVWLDEDETGTLASLSVSRGRGSTLFHVTSEQWSKVLDLVGGWPTGDEDEDEDYAKAAGEAAAATAARKRGQRFSSHPGFNKAVEMRAMRAATAFFKGKGYEVRDTSSGHPYDLEGTKAGRVVRCEVKGTTGDASSVFLTKNEVNHARGRESGMILYILHGIEVVEEGGKLVGQGGTEKVIWPWKVDDHGDLTALSFKYRLTEEGR